MLGGKWTPYNEKLVLKTRDWMVKQIVKGGFSVIVDDTNLHPKHWTRMQQIAQEINKEEGCKNPVVAQLNTDFLSVPIEECIRRDLVCPNSVGEKVIRDFHDSFIKEPDVELDLVVQDLALPRAIICDLDGTLALHRGNRGPFEFQKVKLDTLSQPIYDLIMADPTRHVILLSGRDGSCETLTREWLFDNKVKYTDLFMRHPGDDRKDSLVKRELYDAHVKGKYYVDFVLDDRDQVVDMWRKELGLTCLQVNYGNF